MFAPLPKISELFFKNTRWLEKKQNSILSAALIITVANVASSLSGLIRERLLISTYFGSEASQKAYEAFQLAFQVPDTLFQLIILGALSAAFIPIFTKYKKKSEQEAFKVSSSVMNILLLIFLVISVVVFIFADPITAQRTGGEFTQRQIQIAANLTRLMLVAQFFFAVSNFMTGILQSYQRFIIPALSPIFYNLGILLGVFTLSSRFGIYAAGIGVIMGAFLHMIIQIPYVLRLGYRYKLVFNFTHHGVKELFNLIPLRVLTLGLSEVQNLALGFFATSIGNLSFVVIKLALRLVAIPIRLFGVPISQASLPFLSQESTDRQLEKFKSLVVQSINQIAFLAFPASVLLLILRLPIVRLVFGTHNFPWQKTLMTGRAVAIIALSIGAQAMVQLLIRAFHALKDTLTPFFVIAGVVATYLGLCWWFVFQLDIGVLGLAWASAVVALIELVLFLGLLEHKVGGIFWDKEFILSQVKMLISSFLMAVFLYLPYRILDELVFNTTRTVELVALTVTTSTIGILVYLYFSMLFDVKEIKYLVRMVNKFGSWQQPLAKSEEVLIEGGAERDDI